MRALALLVAGIVKSASREHLINEISQQAVILVHHGFMVAPAPDKPPLLNFRTAPLRLWKADRCQALIAG